MAIPLQTAGLWAEERRQRPFSGRLLQLGRQSLFFDRKGFHEWCQFNQLARITDEETLSDVAFFQTLGFSQVESMDLTNDEHPTFQHDLCNPVPPTLHGQFDCVYDGGTIEHVFDVATALNSTVRMLKVGGRAIHLAVMSNYVDHGFYQFSPTLFHDFYSANGFAIEEILLLDLLVSGRMQFLHPWRLFRYTTGSCDHFNSGAWGFSPWPAAVWVVARKLENRPTITRPVQSLYSRGLLRPAENPSPSRTTWKSWLQRGALPIYLPLVKLKRLFHTPRPPLIGKIDATGRVHVL